MGTLHGDIPSALHRDKLDTLQVETQSTLHADMLQCSYINYRHPHTGRLPVVCRSQPSEAGCLALVADWQVPPGDPLALGRSGSTTPPSPWHSGAPSHLALSQTRDAAAPVSQIQQLLFSETRYKAYISILAFIKSLSYPFFHESLRIILMSLFLLGEGQ